jgi:hypothetical protein
MTERTDFPSGGDPAAPTTMEGSGTLASEGAQTLQDGGALENDGDQWGPTKLPKTDAADPAGDDEQRSPLADAAADDPQLSDGRANSAPGG